MRYKPPSRLAERVYKALKLTRFDVQTEVAYGRLRFDFVVPELRVAIEADGTQHGSFNSFYHDSKYAFRDQKKRDEKKADIAADDGLTLIRLSEKEIMGSSSPEELLQLILQKIADTRSESESEW